MQALTNQNHTGPSLKSCTEKREKNESFKSPDHWAGCMGTDSSAFLEVSTAGTGQWGGCTVLGHLFISFPCNGELTLYTLAIHRPRTQVVKPRSTLEWRAGAFKMHRPLRSAVSVSARSTTPKAGRKGSAFVCTGSHGTFGCSAFSKSIACTTSVQCSAI